IATRHPHLLKKFGGHAMAAGLSIAREHYEEFSSIFAATVSESVSLEALAHTVDTDGVLHPSEFTLENAELLQSGGPWGQQFPEPLFDGEFEIISQRLVGEQHLKMTVKPEEGKYPVEVIAFQVDLTAWPNYRCSRVRMVYRLDKNEFRGTAGLQLVADTLIPLL